MKIKYVYYSSHFKKSLNKFTPSQKATSKKKITLFLNNPFSPQLKTHKLKGKLAKYWSFSIAHDIRVLFEFMDKNTVGFIDIGTHRIYG